VAKLVLEVPMIFGVFFSLTNHSKDLAVLLQVHEN
jgi:hypothetical protein